MKKSYLLITMTCLMMANICLAQDNAKSKSYMTPGSFPFTVPKGATTLTVALYGAGGWGGGINGSLKGNGGSGGFVSGEIPVKEGEILTIVVSAGGGPGKVAGITAILREKEYLAIAAGGGNGSSHGGKGGNGGQAGN